MSYPDPEIVKSDGLLRLKWEEERERASLRFMILLYILNFCNVNMK